MVYDSGMPDGLHTHMPSNAASVPPIHTLFPAAAVTTSAFSAAEWTLASCRPFARQAALASLHDRASFISVYTGGGGGRLDGGGEGLGGGGGGLVFDHRLSQAYFSFVVHNASFHVLPRISC